MSKFNRLKFVFEKLFYLFSIRSLVILEFLCGDGDQ